MALRVERDGDVDVVVIDRPEAANALNGVLLDELDGYLAEFGSRGARAVIVTGTGERAFSAGADVKELAERSPAERTAASLRGQTVFRRLELLPVPTIALVNGFALGGGLELALACTFRLATPHAKLGFPEIKIGLIPSYGGTQLLPRLVGRAKALELILGGEPLGAAEALEAGLVNAVVSGEPLAEALAFARRFTGYSLATIEPALAAVRAAAGDGVEDGFAQELWAAEAVFATEDADEGMRSFVEKRKPVFRDR